MIQAFGVDLDLVFGFWFSDRNRLMCGARGALLLIEVLLDRSSGFDNDCLCSNLRVPRNWLRLFIFLLGHFRSFFFRFSCFWFLLHKLGPCLHAASFTDSMFHVSRSGTAEEGVELSELLLAYRAIARERA